MEEIPLMKVGTPKNVADAVEFLLSGKADYMTGEIIKSKRWLVYLREIL